MRKAYKLYLEPEDVHTRIEYVIFDEAPEDDEIFADSDLWFDHVISANGGYYLENYIEIDEEDIPEKDRNRVWES